MTKSFLNVNNLIDKPPKSVFPISMSILIQELTKDDMDIKVISRIEL